MGDLFNVVAFGRTDLIQQANNVFAQHAQDEQAQAVKKGHQDDQRRPAGHRRADKNGAYQIVNAQQKAEQGNHHARQTDKPQRVRGIIEQNPHDESEDFDEVVVACARRSGSRKSYPPRPAE